MSDFISAQTEPIPTLSSRAKKVDWEAVYRTEMPRIYNFLRYRLRDEMVAEDLTAVTFEKAWRYRNRYEPESSAFSTWLFTIARNTATDYLRGKKEHLPLLESAVSNAPSPEETVTRQQDLALLHRILSELPEREQEIIALKYGAELTNRQIARQMGLSAVNVRIILFRTIRKLRPHLEE
ncbi:MAG: sigma-70 family RNA polymerase sigma factor [Candidatus Promineifilaceae bacterium]